MYKLKSTLLGHQSDVRGLTAISDSLIVSCSRDGTARSWQADLLVDANSSGAVCFSSPTRSFINCIEAVGLSDSEPPLVACGGKDAVIYICETHESYVKPGDDFGKFQLPGHQGNVCSLHHEGNQLISGSWDCTAKVWDLSSFSVKYDLVGHSASVWDAKIVDAENEIYLTCSADRTIRKWIKGVEVACYNGHADVVRKLLVLPDKKHFASASNDCTIKIWDIDTGALRHTMTGHNSFVYDLSLLSNGNIVSTAEDRSVRIWKNGSVVQVITLPCLSVWCVTVLPNDDIAVGGSDNQIYVFSSDPSRFATKEGLSAFEELVRSSAIPEQSLDDLKKSDIPGYESLKRPGKEEGSTVMVKSPAGIIEAHQWSGGQWTKIGDVVNSAGGASDKKEYNGKMYDYVFDVDVEDGKPPLKLPFNATENPYSAAERFLADNLLPASYKEEIVQFINKNTGGFQMDTQTQEPVQNPYLSSDTHTQVPSSVSSFFPQNSPLTFKDYKSEQLVKGLTKFNSTQPEISALSMTQLKKIEKSLSDLKSKDAVYLVTDIISLILDKWDKSSRLIGFDLLRISIPRMTTVDLIQSTDAAENVFKQIAHCLGEITEDDVTLLMMISKVLCNLTVSTLFVQIFFTVTDDGLVEFNDFFEDLMSNITVIVKVMTSSNEAKTHKHFKLAFSTLASFFFDISVSLGTNKTLSSNKTSLETVSAVLEEIGDDLINADEEAAYRLCVTYGNFLANGMKSTPAWYNAAKRIYTGDRFQKVYGEIDRL